MSDNIPPLDLQVEIMKRLPVKSLLQFRSVSKAWKSAIDSPPFIARYSGPRHLLLSYSDELDDCKYDSIVDDNTFPYQRVSITLPPQCEITMLECDTMIGSSHGLFCLHDFPLTKAVIWNPSIRKAVAVDVPKVADAALVVPNAFYATVLGFGVCRETSDPKIVKIAYHTRRSVMFSTSGVPWQVEVFTLSTGSWRSLYSPNISRKSIKLSEFNTVVIYGVHYWLVKEGITMDADESRIRMLIVSFDMTTEEFGEVNLPDSVAHQPIGDLLIYELRGSPVLLQHCVDVEEANDSFYCVWMMGEDVPKSFTKILTFNSHTLDLPVFYVMGFRKSGELLIAIIRTYGANTCTALAVYEPYSKSLSYIRDNEGVMPHNVYFYVESLLLL